MWIEAIGFVGAALTIATYSLRTMIPLRIVALTSNAIFILYGFLTQTPALMVMSPVLALLNAWRLQQMWVLVRKTRNALQGDLSMDWLRPYGRSFRVTDGQVLFRKDDKANAMYCVESGRFRLIESGIELGAHEIVGELGLLSADNRRTQGLVCVESGTLLRVSYTNLKQLYYQNPQFGFYLLRLVAERLFQNADRAIPARTDLPHMSPTNHPRFAPRRNREPGM